MNYATSKAARTADASIGVEPFQFTPGTPGRSGSVLLLVVLAGLMAGCATSGRDASRDAHTPSGEVRPFVPAHVSSGLQLADGRYPTLFSGASNAAWLRADMPLPDAEAEEAAALFGDQFLVFRVELESVFADMSIAYDAVGLRGIHVYALTALDEKVHPAQTIIGSELHEEQRGALRVFRRVSYLLFPKSAARLHVPWTGTPLSVTRLVLEGYDTTFYFEWRPETPDRLPHAPLSELPAVRSGKESIRDAGQKTRGFLRRFD